MSSEVDFAKAFLTTLESRPIKLESDYAADPKTFTPKGAYTLPRMSHSMKKPEKAAAPGSVPAVTVVLKSLKNPPLDLSLPAQPITTSMLELKQKIAGDIGLEGTDKIRLLYNKKPSTDSKSIKDIIGDTPGKTIEFTVMIMGGVPAKKPAQLGGDTQMQDAPVAQGESGASVMQSATFWTDLQGFLEQRVRDTQLAERAAKIFAQAWKEQGEMV